MGQKFQKKKLQTFIYFAKNYNDQTRSLTKNIIDRVIYLCYQQEKGVANKLDYQSREVIKIQLLKH